jgi:hypothetical protein
MRVEVKTTQKKQSGLGVGLLIACGALFVLAYHLGGKSYAGMFPATVERAFGNLRAEADAVIENAGKNFGNTYRSVAGR